MKRTILLASAILFSTFTFSQSIKSEERSVSFESGNHNSIVINIPNVTVEFTEKKIKEELKEWGGKYSSTKNEFSVTQAKTKEIGEKLFDGQVKMIDSKPGFVSVAFAVDLGGAYLTSSQHKDQYAAFSEKLNLFAIESAKEFMNNILIEQEKKSKEILKSKVELVKEIQEFEEEIVNHNKKIEELKTKIENSKENQVKAEEDLQKQAVLIEQTKNKIHSIE